MTTGLLALLTLSTAGCVVASYLTNGLLSGALTLLGFLVGLLLGLLLGKGNTPKHLDHPEHHMTTAKLPQGFFIYVIAIVQAGIAAMLLYVIVDQKGYEDCMARWQQAATISTNTRSVANAAVQAKLDSIILSIPDGDRAVFRKAVTDYLAERERQETQRSKNPIPPLPETVCGDGS